jgi:membrane protein YdbS with pleckstrin-like domain
MENMGATRALGKKVTVMSRCQKVLIGFVVLAALVGIGIGTAVYVTSRSTPSYAFPIVSTTYYI